jgi:predicted HD superfamily hydrolase involved in NAD metabolism
LLDRYVGSSRRAHSGAVARLAASLCRRFGADPMLGVLAGLGHDLARELPAARLLALAEEDGRLITPEERDRPVLLHGRAAAVLLRREGWACPTEVLDAVADHVTGRPGMPLLSRIVFVADYLEPERGFLDSGERAGILRLDLDCMVLKVLEGVIAHLENSGERVAAPAAALYHELGGAC